MCLQLEGKKEQIILEQMNDPILKLCFKLLKKKEQLI